MDIALIDGAITCVVLDSAPDVVTVVDVDTKNGTDGVYNDDPNKNKNAVKYERLGYNDIIRNNLNVMDQTAIAMCKDNGLDLIVFSMNEKGNIKKAVLGEHVGTIVCKEENV